MQDPGYEWLRVVGGYRQLKEYIGYVFRYTTPYYENTRLGHAGRIVAIDEFKVVYENCGKQKTVGISHMEEFAVLKKEYDDYG
jgi:hypothetical protein